MTKVDEPRVMQSARDFLITCGDHGGHTAVLAPHLNLALGVVLSRFVPHELKADAGSLLVRTDFSDDASWRALVEDATKPYGPDGFMAHFVPVDDRAFDGMGAEELATHRGDAYFVFAADGASMRGSDRTLLVVDRSRDRGRSFRVSVAHAHEVENNLSLFNMDFFEFADAVGPDGVFRGFRRA